MASKQFYCKIEIFSTVDPQLAGKVWREYAIYRGATVDEAIAKVAQRYRWLGEGHPMQRQCYSVTAKERGNPDNVGTRIMVSDPVEWADRQFEYLKSLTTK